MNNKFKKGALALGTIATIAAPVAAVVSCGTVNTIDYDAKANYQPGQTWEEFINSLDGMGLKDKSLLNKGEYQASIILYDQEVKASINSQIDSFNYEYYTKTNQLNDLKKLTDGLKAKADAATTDEDKASTKAAYDAHVKKVSDLEEKELKDLKSKLDELIKLGTGDTSSKINYDSNTLSSDYPLLLLPTENIAKEKQSYLDDAKENFISQFDTRSEGQGKWPEERSSKYNGATSDSEAVDYLVNQSIASKAMGKFKFEINSSFNLEQYIYARSMDDGTFSFLSSDAGLVKINSKYKTVVDTLITSVKAETDLDKKIELIHTWVKANPTKSVSKVYFVSSSSENKIWWSDFGKDLALPSKVIEVKHALVGIKRGTDDKDPWEAAQADVLKLLTTINDGTGTTGIIGYNAITDDRLFSDEDFTSAALKNFVTTDGSVANGGSLGFNSVLGYVKSMVEGFGLGVLEQSETAAGPTINDGSTQIKAFKTAMDKALEDALKAIGIDKATFDGDSVADKNEAVKRALTYMGADKIKTVFGSIFRDTLGDTKRLVSSFGVKGNSFVVSSFGVHIIHEADAGTVKDEAETDIQALADGTYTTSKTGVTSLINNHFTQVEILKTLVDDATINKDLETKFKEAIKKDDSTADADQAWTDFNTLITQSLKAQGEQELQTALGTKISTWYVGQIDAGIIDTTLSPSALYALADGAKGVN